MAIRHEKAQKPLCGRPVKYPMSPSIPDTPKNVLKAIFAGPSKKE